MKRFKAQQIYLLFILILSSFFISGCGGGGDVTGHWLPSGISDISVTFTVPANGDTDVPINTKVSATFSDVMDAATINTTTFTLKQGTVAVAGTVTYSGVTAVFTPASTLAVNTTYTATITSWAKDLAGNRLDNDYVWSFTTGAIPDTTRPMVTHTINENGATGVPINTKVGATFSKAMDPLTINTATFTFKQGTTAVAGTVTYSGVTAVFTPSSPLAFNTTYTATITTGATDLAGNQLAGNQAPLPAASNYVWSWTTGAAPDTTAPTVTFTVPAKGDTGVPINTKVGATFSKAMDPLTITTKTFTLKQGTTVVPGTVIYSGVTAIFSPLLSPLAFSTTYTATITTGAKDLAGNALASDYVWSFTTGAAPDTTPPTVTNTINANGATGVPVNTKVGATFSKAMNPLTITTTTFTFKQGTTAVAGTVTYSGVSAVFTPSSPLAFNTTYTATITTGATDLAGNRLSGNQAPFPAASDYVWSWTTGAAPDTTRPTVILTIPLNAATGVPINTKVSATFSEAMDPLTITNLTFTLKQGTTVVPGTVIYSGVTAVFTPLSLLTANTPYTATITTGARDLAGNALASDYTWSFVTGNAADIVAPSIIAEIYPNGATNVPINTQVVAKFSKVMDPLTITNLTFTLKQGTTVIPGTVTLPYPGNYAIFDPLSDLAYNTTYTATVTTGAKDLVGNALVPGLLPNPWSFTTGAIPVPIHLGPDPVPLGAAAPFAILSGSGISSVPSSAITGNIGVSPTTGASITGQTCGDVLGLIYTVDATGPACRVIDAVGLTAAKAALTVAYNDAAGRSVPAPATVSGDQGGLTLPPGIYKSTSSLIIASGDLTLDGQGDATAVWIFQIASTLTTVGCGASVPCATGGNVRLIGGANAANIFWQVGTAATIGDFTQFYGTILAHDDISVNTGARIDGRLLSGAQPSGFGGVTLIGDTIIKP